VYNWYNRELNYENIIMEKIININKEEKKKQKEDVFEQENIKLLNTTKENKRIVVIEFSWKIILFVLFILGIVFWSQQIFTVLIYLFFSLVLMSAAFPIVNWFRKREISKGWAIFLTYFLGIVIILGVISVVVIPFANQIGKLVSTIPVWIENILQYLEQMSILGISIEASFVKKFLTDWLEGITIMDNFGKLAGTFGDIFTWLSLFVVSVITSVYFIMEHNNILDVVFIRITSEEKKDRIKKLVLDLENKLGKWLIGQAVVSAITATYCGIVLSILGVPFALPLAILTGFINVIPNLGSTIAGFLMSLIALLSVGPLPAVILLVAFVLYQPIENGIIVPKVLGDVVGLKPVVILLGVIIALIFFGIAGGLVAVPLMVMAEILYVFYIDLQKIQAKGSI
jgi:predicted PurR-regulated permease PerM